MKSASSPAAADTTPSGPRRRILVATDRPTSADVRSLVAALEHRGFDVTLSTTGEQTERPTTDCACVVIEWTPADAACRDLLQHVRREERERHTYVIVLLPDGTAVDPEELIAAGADDFLRAPLDRTAVLARLGVAERFLTLQDDVSLKSRRLRESNVRLEEVNRRLHEQLTSAARVQQALLPASHFRVPGYDIGWRLRPCDELAGDILNCIRVDEHHLACYVLDVSGHGVSAALLSVQVSRLLTPMISESTVLKKPLAEPPWYRVVGPAEVVGQLNDMFQMTPDLPQYFTIVYALLHLETGRMRLASAGHPPPIHMRADGSPTAVPCRGIPVGFAPRTRYDECELTLARGDRLWFCSDGIVEAANRQGEMLGHQGLIRQIARQNDSPSQNAVDEVMGSVEYWTRPECPNDDCSLLAIEAVGK